MANPSFEDMMNSALETPIMDVTVTKTPEGGQTVENQQIIPPGFVRDMETGGVIRDTSRTLDNATKNFMYGLTNQYGDLAYGVAGTSADLQEALGLIPKGTAQTVRQMIEDQKSQFRATSPYRPDTESPVMRGVVS